MCSPRVQSFKLKLIPKRISFKSNNDIFVAGVFFVCFGSAVAFFVLLPQLLLFFVSPHEYVLEFATACVFGYSLPQVLSSYLCRGCFPYFFVVQLAFFFFANACVFCLSVVEFVSLFGSLPLVLSVASSISFRHGHRNCAGFMQQKKSFISTLIFFIITTTVIIIRSSLLLELQFRRCT